MSSPITRRTAEAQRLLEALGFDRERTNERSAGGGTLALSPGGQNILIKQMVEDFCSYFTPGGEVLYVRAWRA